MEYKRHAALLTAIFLALSACAAPNVEPPTTEPPASTAPPTTAPPTPTTQPPTTQPPATTAPPTTEAPTNPDGVAANGALQLIGTQLCNQDGDPVRLRGMSSHGIHWFGRFAEEPAIRATHDAGANVFRVAMYTDEGGYISSPDIKESVFAAVDAAIGLDMYAIIDWHILHDGNPNTHAAEAKDFFAEAAERYGDSPNVIYEICNEPNGNVGWKNDIRPYALDVIPVIREHAPSSIIIVGTATWSQDIHEVAGDPLPFENIMYALHFYAGTHTGWLRDRIAKAIEDGTPVFVSEWGTSAADGSGGVYLDEALLWIDFMSEHNLSWCNWSLCDKNESSAALQPGAQTPDSGTWSDSDLSPSGRFVFAHFK